MNRAVSIHLGVNQPLDRRRERVDKSETAAWQMAELACQAGYDSVLVLRGQEATLDAVHTALTRLSPALEQGDVLLVTYSGHGGQVRDKMDDAEDRDPDGFDETWCLYDGDLVDDRLSAYWQLFNPGVRIVVVSESCYGAGMGRTSYGCARPVLVPQPERRAQSASAPGDVDAASATATGAGMGRTSYGYARPALVPQPERRARSASAPGNADAASATATGACMIAPSRITDRIRASVLLLTAAAESQEAPSGILTELLVELWDSGRCPHTYAELYQRLNQRMMGSGYSSHLLMLGTADEEFPTLPAFQRPRGGGARRNGGYRSR